MTKSALVCVLLLLPFPSQAHEIYTTLHAYDGVPCCNQTDCRPAEFRVTPAGVKMFIEDQWHDIPSERIQHLALEGDHGATGGGHWCGTTRHFDLWEGKLVFTRCAIIPPSVTSLTFDSRFH